MDSPHNAQKNPFFKSQLANTTNVNPFAVGATATQVNANALLEMRFQHKENSVQLLTQRALSPLLAAVDDIARRDAEFQLYLQQNLQKNVAEQAINTPVTNCVLIADKTVPSYAKATLPTKYLRFGAVDAATNEVTVCARVALQANIKFGPLQGVLVYYNTHSLADLRQLTNNPNYPIYFIDEMCLLDVSNEANSNWMRYVRLASTFAEQNMLLELQNGCIYFKTLRAIKSKEQLRVGYAVCYATRFDLPQLQPTANDLCKEREVATKSTQLKPIASRKTLAADKRKFKYNLRTCKTVTLTGSVQKSLRKSKSKFKAAKLVAKSEQHQQHVYKCNLCNKVFRTAEKLQSHKQIAHADCKSKPFSCAVCQQQCATPTALKAHERSHIVKSYNCIFCSQEFKYARKFKKHVEVHRTTEGIFPCSYCAKKYQHYHLVRKHVRLFHAKQKTTQSEKDVQQSMEAEKHESVTSNESVQPIEKTAMSTCEMQVLMSVIANEINHVQEKIDSFNQQLNHKKRFKKCKENEETQVLNAVNFGAFFGKSNFQSTASQEQQQQITAPTANFAEPFKTHTKSSDSLTSSIPTKPNYIFKCHLCCKSNSFKRRGILVNHYAKFHPQVNLNDIAILQQPVYKEKLIYHCPHCSHMYKSNAKRKAHIQKHHPEQQLPGSLHCVANRSMDIIETVGISVTEIHKCQHCSLQYAARSKLLNHYRKSHPEQEAPKLITTLAPTTDFVEQHLQQTNCSFLESDMNMTTYHTAPLAAVPICMPSPENGLLKLSSAALELSRYDDFLKETAADASNTLPYELFNDEQSLVDVAAAVNYLDKQQRNIEMEFFEKVANCDRTNKEFL